MLYLSPDELNAALSLRDLSDPAQGPHAIQLVLDGIASSLADRWDVPTRTLRHNALVPVADNYDRLGFDPRAVTRDRRYSRYVSPTVMLRSHTSAAISWLLSQIDPRPRGHDELLLLPGLVYRRDAIDRTHVGEPHQLDLWRISSRRLDSGDLDEMVSAVVESVLPGARWRTTPTQHPYTASGRQIDVLVGDEWLELGECGLVSARLLLAANLDPARWGGLALGLGLDRALMLRKGIPDIRLLRATDPRIATQMQDLEPWRPVSLMPPIRRDLSLVVPDTVDAETLGDSARSGLGGRAGDLESLELLALTPAADLPERARKRLRIHPGQANAVVRVTLRSLSRTVTDAEANALRDSLYVALHEGPVAELIG